MPSIRVIIMGDGEDKHSAWECNKCTSITYDYSLKRPGILTCESCKQRYNPVYVDLTQ